jgi:hypothetical protein
MRIDDNEDMRTTMSIDDDVMEQVKQYAGNRSVSMGEAATELLRRGLTRPLPTRIMNGLHIPILPPSGVKLTSEMVEKLESEQGMEEMEKVLPYLRKRKR